MLKYLNKRPKKKMKKMTDQEAHQIIEGIIIEADFGFNIKYTDLEHLYLKLIVQQFDGFYETYGVKRGDGMYLAPKDRLEVW